MKKKKTMSETAFGKIESDVCMHVHMYSSFRSLISFLTVYVCLDAYKCQLESSAAITACLRRRFLLSCLGLCREEMLCLTALHGA